MARPDSEQLKTILNHIGKRENERTSLPGVSIGVFGDSYAAAFITPDDQEFIPALQAAILAYQPDARIALVHLPKPSARPWKDPLRMLVAVLQRDVLHESPDSRSASLDEWANFRLAAKLFSIVDYLILDGAEWLNTVSLHVLRRDKGMCPTIFVTRDAHRFTRTLARDEMLRGRMLSVRSVEQDAQGEV